MACSTWQFDYFSTGVWQIFLLVITVKVKLCWIFARGTGFLWDSVLLKWGDDIFFR